MPASDPPTALPIYSPPCHSDVERALIGFGSPHDHGRSEQTAWAAAE